MSDFQIDKVNSWNGWDPLKQVLLGNIVEPEFFNDLPDTKMRDIMQQLLYETHEDLNGIQKTLESLGVQVVRTPANATQLADLNYKGESSPQFTSVMEWWESLSERKKKSAQIPKPCLSPRDFLIVMGDKMLATNAISSSKALTESGQTLINPNCLDLRLSDEFWCVSERLGPLRPSKIWLEQTFGNKWKQDWFDPDAYEKYIEDPDYANFIGHTSGFWAPQVTRAGDTLIIDTEEIENLDTYLMELYPHYKKTNVAIGGHNDGSFCLAKPGLVITAPWIDQEQFKTTVPGWDIFTVEQDTSRTKQFMEIYDRGFQLRNFWTPFAKDNPEFLDFIQNWLSDWVGWAEESVFEVNMVSVNENTILSTNYDKKVHQALKSRGIEPIYCRFRHRHFWDAGLHCLTVDTVREGGMQNYFD